MIQNNLSGKLTTVFLKVILWQGTANPSLVEYSFREKASHVSKSPGNKIVWAIIHSPILIGIIDLK